MFIELELNGLDCVNCAEDIENKTRKMQGVKNTTLNFATKKFKVEIEDDKLYNFILKDIIETVNILEPDVDIIELGNNKLNKDKIILELNGLDCTDCAKKIEELIGEIQGVRNVKFNFINKKLEIQLTEVKSYEKILHKSKEIINKLEPGVEIIELMGSKGRNKEVYFKLSNIDSLEFMEGLINSIKGIKGVEDSEFLKEEMILELVIREDIKTIAVTKEIEELFKLIYPNTKLERIKNIEKTENKKSRLDKYGIDKKDLLSILGSILLSSVAYLFKLDNPWAFGFYFLAYILVGHGIIKQAFVNVLAGIPFDENFLMTIATIAAFIIGEYPEGVMVMLLYRIGETMQGIAVNHSRDSITALMDIRPDYVNLEYNNEVIEVSPEEVAIGDIIVIRPGEKVPLDGKVIEGKSSLDTSNVTGESVPRKIESGEEILSGVVNIQGLLRVEVSKEIGESTVTKILDLVENASSKKAETENFITRFARYYTPIVVFIALGLMIIPPILGIGVLKDWLYKASIFLVISCPCALVISVPLGFFGGLGGASKQGILVKGGNYLEVLSQIDTVVFDKTGTVTQGVFEVSEIISYSEYKKEELLEIAAHGESHSNHPIAKSIVDKFDGVIDNNKISNYQEIPGKGIKVDFKSKKLLLGNKKLFKDNNIKVKEVDSIGTIVYIAEGKRHIGTIIVSDKIKETAYEDLQNLKKLGVSELVMLSGDNIETVEKVGESLGLDRVYGNLLPQDKVEIFERIISSKEGKVAFVGDGVNDAPVLARADVGIAMGGLGADAAIEASDVVIMTDDLGKIAKGIKIGRNTKKIVIQNIILALGVKLIVLGLGLFAKATMWQAVFADVGVSIIAILNSIRALRVKD